MSLTALLALAREMPAVSSWIEQLGVGQRLVEAAGVPPGARAYAAAALHRALRRPLLLVVDGAARARQLAQELRLWSADPASIAWFPELEVQPYERLQEERDTLWRRLAVLAAWRGVGEPTLLPPLVVTSAAALCQPLPARATFDAGCFTLRRDEPVDLDRLLLTLVQLGYQAETLVDEVGSFAHRGGILDIFPPTFAQPVRIELFGDAVDSLRLFDPESQVSQRQLDAVGIGPAAELLPSMGPAVAQRLAAIDLAPLRPEERERWQRDLESLREAQAFDAMELYRPYFCQPPSTLLDFTPAECLLVLEEEWALQRAWTERREEAERLREEAVAQALLPPDFTAAVVLQPSEVAAALEGRQRVAMTSAPGDHLTGFRTVPTYAGRVKALLDDCQALAGEGRRVVLASLQTRRLEELLEERGVPVTASAGLTRVPAPGGISLVHAQPVEGWQEEGSGIVLLTDVEMFGWAKPRRITRQRKVSSRVFLADLTPGDFVVHVEHGVARYQGIVKRAIDGIEREYLLLEYAAGDKLFVPVEQMDRVGSYIGMGEQTPALTRLGTAEWANAKSRVKASVRQIAADLIALYSERQRTPGHAFSPDGPWQSQLEESFQYVETADQLQAIEDVKRDMEAPRAMDRLVCGDVGYGKTEVAVRAAFKAVADGKQVAVLVPTTVLAEQHLNTFRQRLGEFPVKVDMLSRFRSPRDQKRVLAEVAAGQIDVIIGTHMLLQKNVQFHDLGLLVIDEEQRFGVMHKERLKQLRHEVDVLTLSATPIPRTLHMSLVGVRDMTVIETPPENRHPIRTYLTEFSDQLVREAILREMDRGGQVYFVHNRVETIYAMAQRLGRIVPEARLAVAHGQMAARELERVMKAFGEGEYDVLVCTTIIESGIDMPNVNTIIINQAGRLGLAQLYQLRGRVGRGAHRAFAYLIRPASEQLPPKAEKRLRAIFEATDLGAGFKIAMKDLEIRGAGNLLGPEQHGFMNSVGFDLYCRLLSEAIEEARGRPAQQQTNVNLDLPFEALIPDSFVPDLTQKINLYQRLAAMSDPEMLPRLEQEIADRYGPLPEPVQNLLRMVGLRCYCRDAGVVAVITEERQVVLKLSGPTPPRSAVPPFPGPVDVRPHILQIRLARGEVERGGIELLAAFVRRLGEVRRAEQREPEVVKAVHGS